MSSVLLTQHSRNLALRAWVMPVPLVLVPPVITAVGYLARHLPWYCYCSSFASEATALSLTKLEAEGHGCPTLPQVVCV